MFPEPGERRHRLIYLGEVSSKPSARRVRVRCDCGKEGEVSFGAWNTGRRQSCGCIQREVAARLRLTHGQTGTGLYDSWRAMKRRCIEGVGGYANVGYDPRWETFEGFLAFPPLGEHAPGMVLGRFGDVGDYTPTNARWISKGANSIEAAAHRGHRLPDGRLARAVAAENGIAKQTWIGRINRGGWSLEDAVSVPAGRSRPAH